MGGLKKECRTAGEKSQWGRNHYQTNGLRIYQQPQLAHK